MPEPSVAEKAEREINRNALLEKLTPDADCLLRAISAHVDDAMLRTIASADYGNDVELHLETLRRIRDEQIVFAPMSWHPREVLALTRWTEPEQMTSSPYTYLHQHVMRAFACAALLRSIAEPESDPYFGDDNATIATLLESLSVLEMSFQREALRFFAWRAKRLPKYSGQSPFYLLALLTLMLRVQSNVPRIELKTVIDWIYDEVRAAYKWLFYAYDVSGSTRDQWLTWLTFYVQQHTIWQALGKEIAAAAENYRNSEGRQNLKALARHLEVVIPME